MRRHKKGSCLSFCCKSENLTKDIFDMLCKWFEFFLLYSRYCIVLFCTRHPQICCPCGSTFDREHSIHKSRNCQWFVVWLELKRINCTKTIKIPIKYYSTSLWQNHCHSIRLSILLLLLLCPFSNTVFFMSYKIFISQKNDG